MVKDKIAHYRLTKKIIETELLRMFPATSSTALEIRVRSSADSLRTRAGDANRAQESADVFTFHIPEKLTQVSNVEALWLVCR